MSTVLIDIETLPAVDWNAEQRHAFVVGKVPKTHKKVDSILEWMRENGEEEFRRTALDFRHGWIACVSRCAARVHRSRNVPGGRGADA